MRIHILYLKLQVQTIKNFCHVLFKRPGSILGRSPQFLASFRFRTVARLSHGVCMWCRTSSWTHRQKGRPLLCLFIKLLLSYVAAVTSYTQPKLWGFIMISYRSLVMISNSGQPISAPKCVSRYILTCYTDILNTITVFKYCVNIISRWINVLSLMSCIAHVFSLRRLTIWTSKAS